MTSTARIRVDTGALRQLSRQLDVAIGMFDRDAGPFNTTANGVAHPTLDQALDGFERDWSDRRREVHGNLEAVAAALTTVASTFEEVEQTLVEALAPAPLPPATGAGPEEMT